MVPWNCGTWRQVTFLINLKGGLHWVLGRWALPSDGFSPLSHEKLRSGVLAPTPKNTAPVRLW